VKTVLFGSSGQLGVELVERLKRLDGSCVCCDLPQYDISDLQSVSAVIRDEKPDGVINASAYTAVDLAEDNRETAFKVNGDGPAHLAACCSAAGIPLIHVSTDYVFDGRGSVPYRESNAVNPLGVYGASKAAGENAVRETLREHIILRTAWLYGVYGNNFVKTMLRLGKSNETIRVVDDQFGCPTSAADLADAVMGVLERIRSDRGGAVWGTYHYCGKGITTWFNFAERIFQCAREFGPLAVKNLVPISTEEYPVKAARPAYSALNCDKIEKNFGISTCPWPASLEKTIRELFTNPS
jgi:dTDP-4-dehydrorhamnose reductase